MDSEAQGTGKRRRARAGRGGWLRLHRRLREHHRYTDSEWVHLWVHCLISAAFLERKDDFDGETVLLAPGQFIASRREISNRTGIDQGKVKRLLNDLVKDQQIKIRAGNKHSMFTVLKWRSYQAEEDEVDPVFDPAMIQRRSSDDPAMIQRTQKTQAGVNKNDVKNVLEAKKGEGESLPGGEEAGLRGGTTADGRFTLPAFTELPSPLFKDNAEGMLKAIDEELEAIRKEAKREPVMVRIGGELMQQGERMEPEARLAVEAWKKRRRQVQRARAG